MDGELVEVLLDRAFASMERLSRRYDDAVARRAVEDLTQGLAGWPQPAAPASLSPGIRLASEVTHGRSAALLAPDKQVGVIVADLELFQRPALIVDVTHDRGRAILAAAGACIARRVIAAPQFNLRGTVHFCGHGMDCGHGDERPACGVYAIHSLAMKVAPASIRRSFDRLSTGAQSFARKGTALGRRLLAQSFRHATNRICATLPTASAGQSGRLWERNAWQMW